MDDERVRVAVVGSYNHALTMSVESVPIPGETVLGEEFTEGVGGKGSNQAVAAARLGADAAFVGCIGTDRFGDDAVDLWGREGVDVTHVDRLGDTHTGVGFVVVDGDGENAISVAPGANDLLDAERVRTAGEAIRSADVLLCQLEVSDEPVVEAARIATEAGTTVVLNPAPARDVPEALLANVDVLTPNRSEGRVLAGYRPGADVADEDLLASLRTLGPEAVVLTLGGDGALVASGEEGESVDRVPAADVEVVDTTGAGDAFNAGFAVARGEGASVLDAARFACATGGLACTGFEVVPALPDRDAVESML